MTIFLFVKYPSLDSQRLLLAKSPHSKYGRLALQGFFYEGTNSILKGFSGIMEQTHSVTFPSNPNFRIWNGHRHSDHSRERGTTQLSDFLTVPAQQHREEDISTHLGGNWYPIGKRKESPYVVKL